MSMQTTTAGIIDGFGPFVSAITKLVKSFNDLDDSTKSTLGYLGGFAITALPTIAALQTMYKTSTVLVGGLWALKGPLIGLPFSLFTKNLQTSATGFSSKGI